MPESSTEDAGPQQPTESDRRLSSNTSTGTPVFGPQLLDEGVLFRLFAPAAASVRLVLDEHSPTARDPLFMHSSGDGWHELAVEDAGPGTRYRFVLPDGSRVPDLASRYAPLGVHGLSEVVDPSAYQWNDEGWRGRPWSEAILYELHVGAFTRKGTFLAATEKLDILRDLGITGIELMGICAFAGQRSWGYDNVQLYAPDSTYGRPEDLKAFIDAAHARGIMVVLDVVYNHFGPEGNYIPRYFPQIFSERHKTAWGAGLNFDGPECREVREFIVQNALYWTGEFHVDGLRLDASHAMIDTSRRHILNELSDRVHEAAGDRSVHLILENEQTITRLLKRDPNGHAPYTAQWNHAVDHIIGLAMIREWNPTDEARLHDTRELSRALAEGFFAGDLSCSTEDSVLVPPTAFVSFIQTHDLVGNRVFGERIDRLAPPEAVRAIAAVYLLMPQIPMLFMGEEWAATTPFPFFSDYGGELAEAVRQGRFEQIKRTSHADAETLSRIPDPQAESTFLAAKLRWEELDDPAHAARLEWYRRVLAVRREQILPLLSGLTERCGTYQVTAVGQFECEWMVRDGRRLCLRANLSVAPSQQQTTRGTGDLLWLEGSEDGDGHLGPWSVRWEMTQGR
jgi:malto-oligosyltrehalose trehalohydrolase